MLSRISFACCIALAQFGTPVLAAPSRARISADDLLSGATLSLTQQLPPPVADEEVLAVDDEMRAFLAEHIQEEAADSVKLHELADAIVNGSFKLQYDDRTRTAAETFRLRKGNCLSFSNLFVALARQVGLHVSFQEVDVPPDWSLQKDAFVLNRHVDIRVELGSAAPRVVDFNVDDFKANYDMRTIPETRALAHFCNNLAVESMQAGDAGSAVRYFRRAVEHDRSFSPAWTNLGTLYLRLGHPAHAEAAYTQALKADAADLVAMSNLANLYDQEGKPERAAWYRKKVTVHRRQNPYFRYRQAREAFAAGDWDAAIGHLKFAIRKKRNEDQFYTLLGTCYLKKGDERAAQRAIARAAEVAATDTLTRPRPAGVDTLLLSSR